MPSVGPTLTPHLLKRNRDEDDDRAPSPDSSEKRQRIMGPTAPRSTSPAGKIGPSMPPGSRSRSSSKYSDSGPAPLIAPKPLRVMGPALPPAPLAERPPDRPQDDSDSSDDDFGPAPFSASESHINERHVSIKSAFDIAPACNEAPGGNQRDEWMTLPPTQDDLAARMDPTKMRARKFNTGKSTGGFRGLSSAWTETPEEKLKRLQDEAMGISTSVNSVAIPSKSKKSKEEERQARKMREKIEASRGKSLVDQHAEKGTGKGKEDDPSARVFDYEKDMAVIGTANHKQRREILNKSKGFGDRFSSGSYL